MEIYILDFSLNKCVASIYTLFNHLEKNKVFLFNDEISKKILTCLHPILPSLSSKLFKKLFEDVPKNFIWPNINKDLLEDNNLNLPIQIKGKMVTTIKTTKGYNEDEILKLIYKIEKVKNKVLDKKIIRVINVQDKIINIITS